MSLLASVRTTSRTIFSLRFARRYASASNEPSSSQSSKPVSSEPTKHVVSSCPAGTVITGLNYLKGEPPILAKPDEEYPAWLWELTKPKVLADDGLGGKAEKRRLRSMHRQKLKDNNLFKVK